MNPVRWLRKKINQKKSVKQAVLNVDVKFRRKRTVQYIKEKNPWFLKLRTHFLKNSKDPVVLKATIASLEQEPSQTIIRTVLSMAVFHKYPYVRKSCDWSIDMIGKISLSRALKAEFYDLFFSDKRSFTNLEVRYSLYLIKKSVVRELECANDIVFDVLQSEHAGKIRFAAVCCLQNLSSTLSEERLIRLASSKSIITAYPAFWALLKKQKVLDDLVYKAMQSQGFELLNQAAVYFVSNSLNLEVGPRFASTVFKLSESKTPDCRIIALKALNQKKNDYFFKLILQISLKDADSGVQLEVIRLLNRSMRLDGIKIIRQVVKSAEMHFRVENDIVPEHALVPLKKLCDLISRLDVPDAEIPDILDLFSKADKNQALDSSTLNMKLFFDRAAFLHAPKIMEYIDGHLDIFMPKAGQNHKRQTLLNRLLKSLFRHINEYDQKLQLRVWKAIFTFSDITICLKLLEWALNSKIKGLTSFLVLKLVLLVKSPKTDAIREFLNKKFEICDLENEGELL